MTAPNVTTTHSPARTAFLAAVRAAADVSPSRSLDKAVASLPAAAQTARAVADALIENGALTAFQAERLLAGRTDGFHLGQYVILEPVGRGSAGRVYKARHRTMNRFVAVKVLNPDRTGTPEAREAVHREARTAAKLAHPNVVTALDVNQTGDRVYIVLEYVDGTSLESLVRAQGRLAIPRACEFVRQAALGLQHAHERGMSHGRLGPGNILVGKPNGVGPADRPAVKVSNFGTGRVVNTGRTANLNAAADAADFLAPEQFTNPAHADPKADLFALGCTLYYLLAGSSPKAGAEAAANGAILHQFAQVTPIETLRPGIPAAVRGILKSLMSLDPAARPVAAADVAAALAPFATDPATDDFICLDVPVGPVTAAADRGILTGAFPGLPNAPSPFADLDASHDGQPTLETVRAATPVSLRLPRPRRKPKPGRGTAVLAFGVAAVIIFLTGMAIVVVVKSMVK